MNVGSTDVSRDGLDARPDDSFITASEEDRVIAAMSTRETDPVAAKESLAERWGVVHDTAHRADTHSNNTAGDSKKKQ